jgi:dTDP-4-dehydrorhamnose reductase
MVQGKNMKIALIGADGQLGKDIYSYFSDSGLTVVPLTEKDIDVCDAKLCSSALLQLKPEIIINTAAFHRVDTCEEELQKTFAVNVTGVKNLAEICLSIKSVLVHFSTDFVFGGYDKRTPYIEDDCPAPVSIYGISKLAGEYVIKYMLERYYICRLSGLYGHSRSIGKGYNFVEMMIDLAEEGRNIKVVDDQVLTPTSTKDVTEKLYRLIRTEKFGLYHMTNSGECSWYEFACEIFRLAGIKPDISPTTSEEFGAKAKRPAYSVLDNKKLREAGIGDMRHWKEALTDYMKERRESNTKSN